MKRSLRQFVAGSLCLLAPALVQAVQLTSEGNTADYPDYAVDSAGNVHLVWYDDDVDNGAIFYKMFANDGTTVLIDTTQVNTPGSGSRAIRPSVAADSNGRVLVIWQDMVDDEVLFARLEPALDDQDGSSANPAVIKTVGDVDLSSASDPVDNDDAKHPKMRIDARDVLHIVYEDDCSGPVKYMQVNADGNVVNGPVDLTPSGSCHDLPDVAVDRNGNAHIVFGTDDVTSDDEVYYAMVKDGTIKIAPTLLTVDDGNRAKHGTVSVDQGGMVYIAYADDGQGTTSEEVFLMKLNPSLDDQDGSEANLGAITVFNKMISADDGQQSWYAFSRLGSNFDKINITWDDDGGCPTSSPGSNTYRHAVVDLDGNVTSGPSDLTTTGAAETCNVLVRGSDGQDLIVYSDGTTGAPEIHSNGAAPIAGVKPIGSSGFTFLGSGGGGGNCSIVNGPTSAWRVGDLWLLMAFVFGLGLWRARRVH